MPWLDKQTFPRLARSTLNELQQNQHEKASLVCVRVQSPSGLAMIGAVCVEYGRPKWPITMLNHTDMVQKDVFIFIFGTLRMLLRTAMKRFFCLKAKDDLGCFALSALPHYNAGKIIALKIHSEYTGTPGII